MLDVGLVKDYRDLLRLRRIMPALERGVIVLVAGEQVCRHLASERLQAVPDLVREGRGRGPAVFVVLKRQLQCGFRPTPRQTARPFRLVRPAA
jgi:hypothetical protein